jgi:hypothetical protein
MQPALCRQAKSGDVSGVRRNLWFNEHHVEHTTPKTKKAPQCPRRFFRREGMLIAGLARRAYLRHFDRFDIDSATTPVKPYDTVDQGKNCVIATQSNISTRQKFRSTLPDDNVSRHHLLTPKFFDTEAFADAVSPILNAALTFFVRHNSDLHSNKKVIGRLLQS